MRRGIRSRRRGCQLRLHGHGVGHALRRRHRRRVAGFTATAAGVPETAASNRRDRVPRPQQRDRPGTGQAVATFGFTGTANGVRRALGSATASFGFTAAASGLRETFGDCRRMPRVHRDGRRRRQGARSGARSIRLHGERHRHDQRHRRRGRIIGFTGTADGVAGTPPVQGSGSPRRRVHRLGRRGADHHRNRRRHPSLHGTARAPWPRVRIRRLRIHRDRGGSCPRARHRCRVAGLHRIGVRRPASRRRSRRHLRLHGDRSGPCRRSRRRRRRGRRIGFNDSTSGGRTTAGVAVAALRVHGRRCRSPIATGVAAAVFGFTAPVTLEPHGVASASFGFTGLVYISPPNPSQPSRLYAVALEVRATPRRESQVDASQSTQRTYLIGV